MKNMKKIFVLGITVTCLTLSSSMMTLDELSIVATANNLLTEAGYTKEEGEAFARAHEGCSVNEYLAEAKKAASESKSTETTTTPTATTAPKATATPKPAHEHKYSTKLTIEPTCSEEGELTYTCECGDTYTEVVPKLEHNYIETVTKEPTCTEKGEKTFKCSLCGDTYTEEIEPTGHIDGQFEITKEATCTEAGERTVYCKVCKEPIRTEVIEPLGHTKLVPMDVDYGILGFVRKGTIENTCIRCKEVISTEEVPVPIWHYIVVGVIGIIILLTIIGVVQAYHEDWKKFFKKLFKRR